MKRILAIILAVLMLLSLSACAGGSQPGTTEGTAELENSSVQVGFGKGKITYNGPISLMGYGNEATRISTGIKSDLYIQCVAITDATGETVLIMACDTATGRYESAVRPTIKKEFGIAEDHMIFTAIHQHSTPTGGQYMEVLRKGAKEAVQQALDDRAPATMYLNTVQTEALSFVRNYLCNDGSFYGPNYGSAASGLKAHESESDKEMRLIKFVREGDKKPIILVNFQAHPHMGAGSADTNQHSDWPGIMRDTLEEELNCHAMYLSGAGGNLNSTSYIKEENISTDYKHHGKRAANYVIKAEDSYTQANLSNIKIAVQTNAYENDHSMDHLKEVAMYLDGLRAKDFSQAVRETKNYPEIHSIYHASAIVGKVSAGPTRELTIGAIAIGDVVFTYHPYEMFDTNGMELRSGTVGNPNYEADEQLENPYKMTFICTLGNGHLGYVPSLLGYTNGGYSTDIAYLAPGSGERLVGDYLQMLNDLYNAE